jgi:PAS domain S-box-containing protein
MSKRLTYEELEERVRELEASKTLREQSTIEGLIDSIQAGVVVHGRDGIVIYSNTTAQLMLGLTREQILGRKLIDPSWTFLQENGSPLPVEEYPVSRAIATKNPVHNLVVGIQRNKNAETIWMLDTAIPEFDENGQITQIVTTFMDISALKMSEEQYRNLFEHTMQEVHLWKLVRDAHGSIETWRLVDANPATLKAWGKSRPEIIGKTADEIFSYDTTRQFMPIVEKIFSEGTPHTWETYFSPTDQYYYYMTSVPFGEYFMSTGIDISGCKQIEDALKESEERHRLFNDPSFGGSIIHDKGRILDCSSGIANLTGYSHDELIGMDVLLLIAPQWREIVMDKIKSGFEEPYEAENIRKDGAFFPSRLHARSIQYHNKSARIVEFRDISEIKKAEQAIEASERLLRNIVDSSTDYIFIKDKNLKTVLCNKTFARAINKKPSDLIGKTDIENGWDPELVKGNPQKGITGYEKDDLEALRGKIVRKTDTATIFGKTHYLDSVKIPLSDENETIFGVLGISRDITEQKKVEEALKENVEMLRTFVDTNPFPIVVTDTEHEKILYWSKSAGDLFGYQPKTATQWFSLAYPDPQYRREVIDRSAPYLEQAQHSKIAVNTGEYQVTCRDGSVRICEVYAQSVSGKLVFTTNDITDRKKAENETQTARELLTKVIDSSIYGMWVSDTEGTVIQVNRSLCKTLNFPKDKIVGKYNVFQDKNLKAQGIMPKVKSVFEKLQPARFEIPWQAAGAGDGELQAARDLYIDVYMFPILNEQGELKNVVCQWLDITEHKQAEEKIRAALDEKEYLMKELNHRVKNNLLMVSSLINLKGAETEIDLSDLKHQIKSISLIHEQLYISKSVTEISCKDYFAALIDSIFSSFTRGGVRIEKSIEDLYLTTKTATSLGLVINEIATNAIKHGFSDKAEFVFSITMKKGIKNTRYELNLSNNGNPFPEDVDFKSTKTLGLRLINALVAQLDGTVELQRKPNPVFTIHFPIEK